VTAERAEARAERNRNGLPVLRAGGNVQFLETLRPGGEWEALRSLVVGAAPAALIDRA
jgi:hypothetical protein